MYDKNSTVSMDGGDIFIGSVVLLLDESSDIAIILILLFYFIFISLFDNIF